MVYAKVSSRIDNQSVETMAGTTRDTFHNGAFGVIQPSARGNRSGMDAMLIAASLPKSASGTVADLGAGAGVAGFAALNLHSDLNLLAVERNAEMAEMAEHSIRLPENSAFNKRARVIRFDVYKSGVDRAKAGLSPECVDHVIMNPPYNSLNMRAPGDALRAEAFMMGEGGIDAWFRTAASILKQGGTFSVIYRTENLGELIACCQGRFGDLKILPIHSRKDEPAKRVVVRGIRGSRAPISILPGFVVHEENGEFTAKADAIFKGEQTLGFSTS